MSFYPRVELHCHLDGALPSSTFYKLALKEGVIDKTVDEITWKNQIIITEAMPLSECLKRFDQITALLQTPENLEEAACSLALSMYEQGIRLAEIRFAPQQHILQMTQNQAVEAVLRGVNKVMSIYPDMIVGIIVCMMNYGEDVDNDEANMDTLNTAIAYKDKGVVGIDLAGAEGAKPTESFRYLFEKAYHEGINITIHAGEVCPAEAVRTAMSMHANRIGHGIHGWNDPDVAKEMIARQIPLEISVTSNILSRCVDLKHHPVREMMDQGAVVTINTDDPLLCNVTLQSEYDLLQKEFGFTEKDLIQVNLNAARASFCQHKEKNIKELEKAFSS